MKKTLIKTRETERYINLIKWKLSIRDNVTLGGKLAG